MTARRALALVLALAMAAAGVVTLRRRSGPRVEVQFADGARITLTESEPAAPLLRAARNALDAAAP